MKKSLNIALLFCTLTILTSCGGSSSSEPAKESESSVTQSAYNQGFEDGKHKRYYNCHSKYDGTEWETDYLLSYKEGYNAGSLEAE